MQRYAILMLVTVGLAGCASHDKTSDNIVRLPDGRPIAMLIAPNAQARPVKLPPIVGNVHSVSEVDIRAAITVSEAFFPQTVRFIRIKDHNTIQLHHEALGDRCLHYDDMRRKKGKWANRGTVVVVEDCGYVPML